MILVPIITQPFHHGDDICSGLRWDPIVRPLPVSKSCSLDQPMSRDKVLGVADLGSYWPCFEDLESRKYASVNKNFAS